MTELSHLVYGLDMNTAARIEEAMNARTTTTGRELVLVVCTPNPPTCIAAPSNLLVCIECGRAFAPGQAPVTGRCQCDGALVRRAG